MQLEPVKCRQWPHQIPRNYLPLASRVLYHSIFIRYLFTPLSHFHSLWGHPICGLDPIFSHKQMRTRESQKPLFTTAAVA